MELIRALENGACSLAGRLIAGRLVPEGCGVEGWCMCRAEFFSLHVRMTFFSFGVVDRKHQGQQLQE